MAPGEGFPPSGGTGWLIPNAFGTLPSELVKCGSRGGIRTPDRVVNSHLLCQLSYPGIEISEYFLYQIVILLVNQYAILSTIAMSY